MRPTVLARPINLTVPESYKAATNVTSGFLTGDLGRRSLKGLFLAPENVHYIGASLVRLVTNIQYVAANLAETRYGGVDTGHPNDNTTQSAYGSGNASSGYGQDSPAGEAQHAAAIVQAFSRNTEAIAALAPALVRAHESAINRAYREDTTVPNPLLALHAQNRLLLTQAAKNLVQSPETIAPELGNYDPDAGAVTAGGGEYDYDQTSYNDGTWHPEHLFTRSQRNSNNSYWTPMEVNICARSGNRERAPGHRYNSSVYGVDAEVSARRRAQGYSQYDAAGNSAAATSASQFPHWQNSQPGRNGMSRNAEGLREGGDGDRRTQGSHGVGARV